MVACTNLAVAIAHRVGSRVQLVGSRTIHLHVVLTPNSTIEEVGVWEDLSAALPSCEPYSPTRGAG